MIKNTWRISPIMEQILQPQTSMRARAGALSCPKFDPLLSMVMNIPETPITGMPLIKMEVKMN